MFLNPLTTAKVSAVSTSLLLKSSCTQLGSFLGQKLCLDQCMGQLCSFISFEPLLTCTLMNTQAEKQALYVQQASFQPADTKHRPGQPQCSACPPLTWGTAEKSGLQTSEEDAELKMCTKPCRRDHFTTKLCALAGSGQPPVPIMSSPPGILPALQPQG